MSLDSVMANNCPAHFALCEVRFEYHLVMSEQGSILRLSVILNMHVLVNTTCITCL